MALKEHLREKRNELIWALGWQDYSFSDIAQIFNIDRSTAMRIIEQMPSSWRPKWKKVD